jgi:CHAD domain-containing protein
MGSTRQHGRVRAYTVGAAFVVPPLEDLIQADGRADVSETVTEDVYYDTSGHDLFGDGVTLWKRSGDNGSSWHLAIDGAPAIDVPAEGDGTDDSVPGELAGLTTGLRRGADLSPVATIRTERQFRRQRDSAEQLVIELLATRVATTAGANGATSARQWRTIETREGPAAGATSGAADPAEPTGAAAIPYWVHRRLVAFGAVPGEIPDSVSVVLGNQAPQHDRKPDLIGTATVGSVVLNYLRAQDTALVRGDVALRRGIDAVHPTRVATRRLRSTLKVFKGVFDEARAHAFDAELSWYAALLGEVRNPQVQRGRMKKLIEDLPLEVILGPVGQRIEDELLGQQRRAEEELRAAMNEERYLELLREARRWVTEPPFTEEAAQPATQLWNAVRAVAKKLEKQLATGLAPHGDEEALHDARKTGKRARYATELAAPVVSGRRAHRLLSTYEELQDELGEFQDGVVTSELLRSLTWTATRPEENGFTFGVLYAHEAHRAEASKRRARKLYAAIKA